MERSIVKSRNRKDFRLNDYAVNIWTEDDFKNVNANTYFLHLKIFSMLNNKFKHAEEKP